MDAKVTSPFSGQWHCLGELVDAAEELASAPGFDAHLGDIIRDMAKVIEALGTYYAISRQLMTASDLHLLETEYDRPVH